MIGRAARRAATLATAACVALGSLALARTAARDDEKRPASQPAKEGGPPMAALSLKVTPAHAEVLYGESLDVLTTLTNDGDKALAVTSPKASRELEFTLTPEGGETRVLSAKRARAARSTDPMPASRTVTVTLEPKKSVEYRDDLAELAVPPLEVGKYALKVRAPAGGTMLESAPTPIAVVGPRVSVLATAEEPSEGTLATVFVHASATGASLFQRESLPERPSDGLTTRRADAAPGAIGGAAAAIELFSKNDGMRWYAWLEADALGAGLVQGKTSFVTSAPTPIGLREARLAEKGWQPSEAVARFAAIGLDAGGKVALSAVTIEVEDEVAKPSTKTIALAAKAVPSLFAVRQRMEKDAVRLDVVWAEAGTSTRIVRQTVDPQAGTASPPVVLLERDDPTLALALAPVASDKPGVVDVVDVLVGLVGDPPVLQLARVPVDGGKLKAEWKLEAPLDTTKKPPEAPSLYALVPALDPNPAVVAKSGDALVVRRATAPKWSALYERAKDVKHVRLERVAGRTIAVVADPGAGLLVLGIGE